MFDAFTFTHNRKQTTDLLMPTQRLPSKYVTVDTARIVCGAGSVYQSGVHLSVPSVYIATSCCGFAAGRPVGRRYQSTAVGGGPPISNGAASAWCTAARYSAANASSVTFTATLEG